MIQIKPEKTMRRATLALLPLAVLAACATPREQCISTVTRDARVLEQLINQTRGNLNRGYALEERQEIRTFPKRCTGENADGVEFTYRCDETRTITTEVPTAIDLNAERAKLASLETRYAQTKAAADQAVLQCISTYPE